MDFNKYQQLAARTMNEKLTPHGTLMHSLHGMVSEIGELHGIYQKQYQGHDLNTEHIKKELGDLLWFIAEFCTANEWDMNDIAWMNIEKLKARFPDGFEEDKSLHRASGDI